MRRALPLLGRNTLRDATVLLRTRYLATQAAMGSAEAVAAVGAHAQKGASLFDDQASKYAQFRPVYPSAVYDAILEFGGQGLAPPGGRRLALDVATGTGQVAAELSRLFDRVVALDSSAAQLAHATARPNVQYLQAAAEQLPGDPATADLVCAAQALHWFDRPAFYAQAARLLKPSGVLAVWCYGRPRLASPPGRPLAAAALAAANGLIEELYSGTLGRYWDERRTLVEQAYAGLEPGPDRFSVAERRELVMADPISLNGMVGYLSSWSALAEYRRQHPDAPDPLAAFKREAAAALGIAEADADDPSLLITEAPLSLILARGPVKAPWRQPAQSVAPPNNNA